jgi:hypothetical protein
MIEQVVEAFVNVSKSRNMTAVGKSRIALRDYPVGAWALSRTRLAFERAAFDSNNPAGRTTRLCARSCIDPAARVAVNAVAHVWNRHECDVIT